MRRWIIQSFSLIATFGDDSLLIHNDGSHRHFTFIKCDDSLVKSFLHPVIMRGERILREKFGQVSGAFRKIMALKNQRDAVMLFALRVVQVMLKAMSNVENRMAITVGGLENVVFL